jgi:predicted lipoprotein with Yx(FWY)xxD motif
MVRRAVKRPGLFCGFRRESALLLARLKGVSVMALRFLLRAFLVIPFVAVTALVATAAPPLASVAGAATESCATPVTSAPTGPATVSVASTAFGRALVVGSGATSGCSLYVLDSDAFKAVSGSFACTNAGPPPVCDTTVWPALLTAGSPVAGPGVNPTLLGTVTRTDVLTGATVQQVTYAGHPLYRFFLDSVPGNTAGEGFFDPFVSPPGVWHLVSPPRGRPALPAAALEQGMVTITKLGTTGTVLEATMDQGLGGVAFPVYTFSADSFPKSACQFPCDVIWPPVLTVGQPLAGSGVDPGTLGIIVRPDGTKQVTFQGRPLYLFIRDARFPPGAPAVANGAGITAFGGTFQTVPPS